MFNVFVLYPDGKHMDIESNKKRYTNGLQLDYVPYNYHKAEKYGWKLEYSQNHKVSLIQKIVRKIFGFDIIHIYRNFDRILSSDIVWTHTEIEYLALFFMFKFHRLSKAQRPKVIAQSVWLWDKWDSYFSIKRKFYQWLLEEADVLTFHSPINLAKCKKILPHKDCRLVYFGSTFEEIGFQEYKPNKNSTIINVLSLGNDIHRDWITLLKALGNKNDVKLTILTHNKIEMTYSNVKIIKANNLKEILYNYEHADVVVVPLNENLHASGITVIFEALYMGKPVVATKAGGLDEYFSEKEVYFVNKNDYKAIYNAVKLLKNNNSMAKNLVENGQKRIKLYEYTDEGYAKRHVLLSKELLEK
jgi:glycosyltransferase involved in cell wall biosynthesis